MEEDTVDMIWVFFKSSHLHYTLLFWSSLTGHFISNTNIG